MRRMVVSYALLLALALNADAGKFWSDTPVTCHWIGAVARGYTPQSDYEDGSYPVPQSPYAMWTNQNNWAEGIVPGRFEVVQEDGTIVTNGCAGCTAVFDGNSVISCISLYGMVSISNILVTGATTPRIVLGHWKWDNPHFCMEAGGGIRVTADVPEAPYVVPQIMPVDIRANSDLFTFENDSRGPLSIGYIAKVNPPLADWHGTLNVTCKGTGDVIKRNRTYIANWSAQLLLDMQGGSYISHSITNVTWGFSTTDNYYYIRDVDNGYRQKILIPAEKVLSVDWTEAVGTEAGMDISGEGILYMGRVNPTPQLFARQGRLLDVSVDIWRHKDASATASGIQIGASGWTGTVRLSGDNVITGRVSVVNAATLEVPSFGFGDTYGPVGRLGVTMSGKSFIRYTGDGETTDRVLSGEGYGTLILAGTGDLVWKGAISGGTTYHYTITNENPAARFVCATKAVSKYLNLVSGTRFAFAKPDDSDSITVDKMGISGAVTVDVIDGVTVTVSELIVDGGRLSVTSTNGGVFRVSGMAEGIAPDWITVNGKTAWISAEGDVYALDERPNDLTIAARGDVVPDAPGNVVGITSSGDAASDSDVLGKDVTTVLALNHETGSDAVIRMSEGQALNANLIRVKSGAGDLAVGDAPGVGTVSVGSGTFETRVDDASATLTVNAALDVPESTLVKVYGEGTTVFSAFNGYEGLLSFHDATVVLTNSSNVTAARFSGTGVYDFSGGVMRLASSDENGVDAVYEGEGPVSFAVTGGVLRLTGEKPLSVNEIRVPHGELVLDGVSISSPGVSIDTDDAVQPSPSLIVGSNGTAVVRLESGAVTGRLELASYVSAVAKGAMYQTGGEFVNVTKNGETFVMGAKGFAYYRLSGGRYVAAGDWYLGAYGEGLLDITGGELYHTPASLHSSRCRIGGWEGWAAMRVADGGVFNATNVSEAVIMPGYNRSEAMGECTVEDGGTVLLSAKGMTLGMGYSADYSHSVLNLNGGLFSSYSVTRGTGYVYPSEEWPEGTSSNEAFRNTYGFVNCNGGTFRNLGYGALFGSRSNAYSYPPNRVTLYERGLTIDTNGKDCRLDPGGGLQAPSGQGVVAVAWDQEKDGKGFVGSPFIRIVGDGLGATAWADFDASTRTVTGIRVTSPGNDYTYANAQIVMNKKVVKTVPCTIGPTVSGGLVKTGSASLGIAATNTYTGATVVRKGSILLKASDVINPASKLVLDGGVLDMNGMSQTFSSVEVTENGGSVVNGTLTLSGLTVDFDDVLAGRHVAYGGAVNFTAGAKFELLNASKVPAPSPFGYLLAVLDGSVSWDDFAVSDGTLDSLPERWQIQRFGSRILLRYPVGSVVTFR